MHPLLQSSIEAHGGLSRWSAFEGLRARMTVRGAIFEVKRIGGFQEDVIYETRLHEEQVTIEGFGGRDRRLRFLPNRLVWETRDGTVLSSRDHPRKSFQGIMMPTTRRVYAYDTSGSKVVEPLLVSVDIADIVFS
jgi:hypothetical protein